MNPVTNKVATKLETDKTTAGLTANTIFGHSKALHKYINNMRAMNKRTAKEYYLILNNFQLFAISKYKTTLDDVITGIKQASEDPYDILSEYVAYLQTGYNISTFTLKNRIITAKNFLEYNDVDISPRKFKLKVKMPKIVRQNKEALSKEEIADILNACSDIKLKTYVMCWQQLECVLQKHYPSVLKIWI